MSVRPDDDESLLPSALCSGTRPFRQMAIYDAPEWYDVDYAAYQGEISFYRFLLGRFLPADGVVVELGAGTGRLALEFAGDGHQVHAVEPSAAMRARLVKKRDEKQLQQKIDVEAAVAKDFRGPPKSPPLVIFPFNGVLHLSSRAELIASFRHVRARLNGAGRFAIDMTGPYWESMLLGSVPWGRVDARVHPVTGRPVHTCDRSTYDSATRTMRVDIRYLHDDEAEGVEVALTQRMWTYPEVLAALEETGFSIELLFGDVDLSPFDDGAARMLVCVQSA